MIWENSIEATHIYVYMKLHIDTYIIICKINNQWEFDVWSWAPKAVLCDSLEGQGGEMGGSDGGDPWMSMADSYWFLAKTITISNYPEIKVNKLKKLFHNHPVAQMVKNLPARPETRVRPWGYSPWGHKELDTIEQLTLSHFCIYFSPYSFFFFSQYSFNRTLSLLNLSQPWQKVFPPAPAKLLTMQLLPVSSCVKTESYWSPFLV